jgi:hypothetical protein
MRVMLTLFAVGAAAYVLSRRTAERGGQSRAAFANDQPDNGANPVRDAGPDAMRDAPIKPWTSVDEASDQSFPASDPPGSY